MRRAFIGCSSTCDLIVYLGWALTLFYCGRRYERSYMAIKNRIRREGLVQRVTNLGAQPSDDRLTAVLDATVRIGWRFQAVTMSEDRLGTVLLVYIR
ncbi:MAG TPA: hypothetical protein VHL53_13120 [Acidimicrobiia bacterium]|nr:hypothetical protein [Acidimicrobiia bacterium]